MQARKGSLSLSLEIILGILIIAAGMGLFIMREGPMLPDTMQIQCCDVADYRYLAEHFWGVPHDLSTYREDFHGYWGTVLSSIPFRDLGTGTVHLLLKHSGFGTTLSLHIFLMLLLASSSLCFFVLACRIVGTTRAALMLGILVLPPQQWILTEKFLAEPFLRALLILLLIPILALTKETKHPVVAATSIVVLSILTSHFKVMWMIFGFLLLPIFLPKLIKQRQWAATAILVGGIAFIPITQSIVHTVGWGNASVSGGVGLHLSGKYQTFLPFVCSQISPNHSPWYFCHTDTSEFKPWWVFLQEQSLSTDVVRLVRSLDEAALPFLLSQPMVTIRDIFEGFRIATNFPDTDSSPLHLIDWLTMIVLFCGLVFRKTSMLSGFALALWVIPAIGNALSTYDGRYHMIMAGIPLAIAVLLLSEIPWTGILQIRKGIHP